MASWVNSGLFHAAAQGSAVDNYSIAIPPPNITGALHMGHALNGSIQDVLIRYKRMSGIPTEWILGTDHAGIATQAKVEERLVEEGSSREAIGRDAFVERVWQWREQFGGTIIEQFGRLGASCDYERERFTLDDGYERAVRQVFCDLYEDGCIYRDQYLVNWDPGSQSAISDLEVEEREVTDTLFEIAYPLADGSGEIVVATVRPETMLGDSAVAVNPADQRYSELIGKRVKLPLTERELEIIADDYVKLDFGSGALKVTPAHDPNDFEIGRRHGLEELTVIGEDGRMTELAGRFAGLKAAEAQQQVVAALREQGLLRGEQPYLHSVPFSHRSGERIEPLISLQWFMNMEQLAPPAIEAVNDGRVSIHPAQPGEALHRLAGADSAVVYLTPALVGSPASGLVSGRRDLGWDGGAAGGRLGARGGRARYLVQLGAVAVRDAWLAPIKQQNCRPFTRPTCSQRRATFCFSGSPEW